MFDHRYDPRDWYWSVGGDAAQVWSSAQAKFVPADDPAVAAWRGAHHSHHPTRIASLAELHDVLAAQVPADLFGCNRAALAEAGGLDPVQFGKHRLAAGLRVTSAKKTSPLDGVYAVDGVSRAALGALLDGFARRGSFPGGGDTYPYPDLAGERHALGQPELQALNAAIEDYALACDLAAEGAGAWPADSIAL